MSSRRNPVHSVGTVIAEHELPAFFVLAFGYSWAAWLPAVGGVDALPPFVAILLGGFGPLAAAVTVTYASGASVRAWGRGLVRWRVDVRWYAAALLVPLLVVGIMTATYLVAGGSIEASLLGERLPLYLGGLAFSVLVGGGQEEPGWRGFALPRLQTVTSPLRASLLVGVLWACWHLPLFYIPGSTQHKLVFVLYGTAVVGLSVVFAWLYNAAESSTLLVMLLHAGVNASTALILVPMDQLSVSVPVAVQVGFVAGTWLLAFVAVARTRGRLGEAHPREKQSRRNDPPAVS